MAEPLVTIAVPSFNQGRFLDDALGSIFQQEISVEVFVLDGGSSDNSIEIIVSGNTDWLGNAVRLIMDRHQQLTKVLLRAGHLMCAG